MGKSATTNQSLTGEFQNGKSGSPFGDTEVEAAPAQAGTNRRDWQYFDRRLGELRVRDVESILARGQLLIEAHEELERGSYEATVKHHTDLGDSRKYRIVAAHPIIASRGHDHGWPPSM